jgi:CHAT domain-containing protein
LNRKTLSRFFKTRKKPWTCWERRWRSKVLIVFSLLLCVVPSFFAIYAGSTPVALAPSQWVATGQSRYQAGRFAEAAIAWQRAADAFAQMPDPLNQAMALSNLSLTEQQLEQWDKSKQSISKSLELIRTQPQTPSQKSVLAATLDIEGQLQLSTGQFDRALQTWQGSDELYQKLGNREAAIVNRINQAQAMQSLGLYPRACQTLLDALGLQPNGCDIGSKFSISASKPFASQLPVPLQILGLRSLGNVFRIMGQSDKAVVVLKQGLQSAQQSKTSPSHIAAIYLALGNTARANGNQRIMTPVGTASVSTASVSTAKSSQPLDCLSERQDTVDAYYQQAAICYGQAAIASPTVALQAELNLFSLMVQTQQWQKVSALLPKIQADLASLSASRISIAAHLKLAQSLMCLQSSLGPGTSNSPNFTSPILESCTPSDQSFQSDRLPQIPTLPDIQQLLTVALNQSRRLEDRKSEANALGYLASVSQQMGNTPEAVRLTEEALHRISAFDTPELAYLWQWQLGRLYQLQAKPTEAVASYTSAFNILQSLRRDLVTADSDLQFAFRDSVEPVYRELVDLLLKFAAPSQENLKLARDVIESLQLAELNNFFREACLDAHPQSIDQLDAKAAVIYGIILPERLAVILSLPGKPLRYFATELKTSTKLKVNATQASQEVENTVGDLFATLNPFVDSSEPLQPQQKLYDWLIRPAVADLEDNHIKTLVFVLDGVLRGVPVAVLHDGSQYLVEKYSLALTPGLQLLSSRPLSSEKLRILAAGVSEAHDGFASLPGVKQEVTEISEILPTEALLNKEFTRDRLRTKIENAPFPVVHLATHAQFSSRADETFLLTWSERVNVKNLDNFLRERSIKTRRPIELLILSACQTAVGDKRATLGLAGVAVRSGARSTMATLWSVQDQSTADLMVQFYKSLNQPQISKADALRKGQLSLLHSAEYKHPYYWAPFVLVGNWL